MSTSRQPILRRKILHILQDTHPYALPEGTVREHLNERERPRATDEEWATAKTWLIDNAAIDKLEGSFGSDEPRLMITERGQVLLRQH